MNAAVDMINARDDAEADRGSRKTTAGKPDVATALADLEKKMLDVELKLLSRSDMNSDDKYYVEPFQVYLNLIWLSGEVGNGAGDVAGGADYAPTESALAWLGDIEKDLNDAKSAYKKLVDVDLAEFNKSMEGKIPVIAETVRPIVP